MSNRQKKSRKNQSSTPLSPTAAEVLNHMVTRLQRAPAPALPPPSTANAREPGTLEQVGREADAAWNGVKHIMSLLNVERKCAVVTQGSVAITASGSVYDLTSAIAQGVGGLQRIGDSIKVGKVHLKMCLVYGGGAGSLTLVLGRSKDSVPSVGNVFQFTGSNAGQNYPATVDKPADVWHKQRYTNLNPVTATFRTEELTAVFNADTTYQPGLATVATGSIWFAAISDVAAGATNPTMYFTALVEYVDN